MNDLSEGQSRHLSWTTGPGHLSCTTSTGSRVEVVATTPEELFLAAMEGCKHLTEEANEALALIGVDGVDSDRQSGDGQMSNLWSHMWRDGRKYGIWLHAIAQAVSELSPGILMSQV